MLLIRLIVDTAFRVSRNERKGERARTLIIVMTLVGLGKCRYQH